MGGHYGSIHVRTDNHEAVRSAVAALAENSKGLKFYVGPLLEGWIGIYPNKNGHDMEVSKALSAKLGNDILHLIVHDDSVFYYFYYYEHTLIDRYDSCPDYFGGRVSEAERRASAGNPTVLKHLLNDPNSVFELERLLCRKRISDEVVFQYETLEEFAALFGIPNAVSAYEYLKGDETNEIEEWEKFEHIPSLKAELEVQRSAEQKVTIENSWLKRQGLLLFQESRPARQKHEFPAKPSVLPGLARDGFLIRWSNRTDANGEVGCLTVPWKEYQPVPLKLEHPASPVAVSPSGRFLLAAGWMSGNYFAELWNVPAGKKVTQIAPCHSYVGFSSDESGIFLAAADALLCVATANGSLTSKTTIPPSSNQVNFALHPSGFILHECAGKVTVIELVSGNTRTSFYLGGKYQIPAIFRQQLLAQHAEFLKQKPEENPIFKKLVAELGKILPADQIKARLAEMQKDMAEQQKNLFKSEEPDKGNESCFALEFSSDGALLFVASSHGCRVFVWEDILNNSSPRPYMAAEPVSKDPRIPGTYVYSLAYDPRANRLLFGGLCELHYLDLATGKCEALLTPPQPMGYTSMRLSSDRSALACAGHPPPNLENLNERKPPELHIWNYPLLLKKANLPTD